MLKPVLRLYSWQMQVSEFYLCDSYYSDQDDRFWFSEIMLALFIIHRLCLNFSEANLGYGHGCISVL